MSQFILFLVASSFLTVGALSRLLRNRFLHPGDLAIVSTFYYAVPLAIAGYLRYNPRSVVFLHQSAADPAIAMRSLEYATAAIIALVAGRWIGALTGPPKLATYFRLDETGEARARLTFVLLLGLVGLGVFQFGLDEFFQGYATDSGLESATLGMALVYFAVGSFGLVIAYALLLLRYTRRRSILLLIAIAIVVALFVLVIRGKRLEIVTTFLPAAMILLAARGSLKIATSRLLLGGGAVAALVAIAFTRISDTVSDGFDLFTFNFYLLSEGLYAGHALPGVIGRFDYGMLGYEFGGRFLNALLGFVPRFLWEGKDDIVYAGNQALDGVSPLGASTFLAEVVLQGGMFAVILVHGILGYLFERAARFEDVWDSALASGRIPGRFVAYLTLTAIFIPHFRDGIIPAVKLSLQAGAVLLILVYLHRVPGALRSNRPDAALPSPTSG